MNRSAIGIICGHGFYPKIAVMACVKKNLNFCLIFINGISSHENFFLEGECENVKFTTLNLGEIGAAIDFFQKNNVKKVIFSGAVKRPNFKQLTLDAKGRQWLAHLGSRIFYGDDGLLRAISELMKKEGFEIISGTELIDKKEIFLSKGTHTNAIPSKSDLRDIEFGAKVARTIGVLDIGQSVIIHEGLVVGIECVEGTDELIKRCAKLRKSDKGGILVKMCKPQQDIRVDLPTIGPSTIDLLCENNFAGVAIDAEKCIVIDKSEVIRKANEASLFVHGVNA